MAMTDMQDGQQTLAGFFSPMLGGGDAVTAGGGGGGEGEGAFDLVDGKVVNCALAFGRRWLECGDAEIPAIDNPSGYIYATVSHPAGQAPTLSVSHGDSLPANGLDVSHRALYKAAGAGTDGRWIDLRRAITIVAMD